MKGLGWDPVFPPAGEPLVQKKELLPDVHDFLASESGGSNPPSANNSKPNSTASVTSFIRP